MSLVTWALIGWFAVQVVFLIFWAALQRKLRQRDEILRDAFERLRGLQEPDSAAARGFEGDPPPSCPHP